MKIDEQTGLYGNYGIWHIPFWQTTIFYTVVAVIAIIIFLLIGFFIFKKYRMKRKKSRPIWEHALQQLELLRKENKISTLHGREFYLTVTAVLKDYLQKRFQLQLKDKTDSEVTTYLKKISALDQIALKNIQNIFRGSITIKFANAEALQEQIERDFRNSVTIIKKTMQSEKDN